MPLPLLMASTSDTKSILSQTEKFDGTNWKEWYTSITAALMLIDALGIAEGTELAPSPIPAIPATDATATTPTQYTNQTEINDWSKRNRQGLSVVILSCTNPIRQRLSTKKSLRDNWLFLETTYGTVSGMGIWIDYQKFFRSEFSPSFPLTTQLDEMANLAARLNAAELPIPDHMLAIAMVFALPSTYDVAKQAIFTTIPKLTQITSADIRQRILSEELRQESSASANAIKVGAKPRSGKGTGKCFWCEGPNHVEADCVRLAFAS
jgi:hypothetical protein